MPIYEYEHDEPTESCDFRIEVFQKMSEEPLTQCPKCGKACHKVLSISKGKVEQDKQFVYADENGNLKRKHLSANRDVAKEQMRQHYRDKGENPEKYDIYIP